MPQLVQFKNNASGTLSAGITDIATSLTLTAGNGASFPSLYFGQYFYATLKDGSNNLEIIKVTARATDTLTIVRAQDNTTAKVYSTNDVLEMRPTAGGMNDLYSQAGNAPDIISIGTDKPIPVDADAVPLYDSTAPTIPSKLTWGSIKATLQSVKWNNAAYADVAGSANALNTSNSYQAANFTATGRVMLANGSAGAPSLAWSSDGATDTGFYWGGDGYTFFTNNGVKSGEIQPGGGLVMVGNVTAYSDIKLKTDLLRIDHALAKVCALTGYTYTRTDSGQRQTGLIAQDVETVLPEAVQDNDGTLSLAYGNLMGLIVEAIKELDAKVEALK